MKAKLSNLISFRVHRNPCILGEILRDIVFVKNRPNDYGCYTTFELVEGFVPVKEGDFDYNAALSWFTKDYDGADYDDIKKNVKIFTSESLGLYVAWYWDNDGTLIISEHGHDGFHLSNTDCKKSTTWT